MTQDTVQQPVPHRDAIDEKSAQSTLLAACIELTKPGITKLVIITALVGLIIGGVQYEVTGFINWVKLILGCAIGTGLASGGANSLNMWYESDRDAKMERTRVRPIPSNRLSPSFVLFYGLSITVVGSLILWLTCGIIPAFIAIITTITYVLVYTPLKPVTITNTLIGALPGAWPTMIGTTAVAPGDVFAVLYEPIGLMLFSLMFLWQLPHFFAIAWMCKDDYESGGFRMLPAVDPKGNHTALSIILTSILLIPCGIAPIWIIPELAGITTAIASIVLGGALVYLSLMFAVYRTKAAARKVFFGSIIHLPVYLIVLMIEALIRGVLL